MNRSDRIVSMLYICIDILASNIYYFCTGKSLSKDVENIKEIISKFKVFKEQFEKNETMCNVIHHSISLWKDE